jgi:hypothetical protein
MVEGAILENFFRKIDKQSLENYIHCLKTQYKRSNKGYYSYLYPGNGIYLILSIHYFSTLTLF